MKLYQLPLVDNSTIVNIDNINFITVDKEDGKWAVYIFFAQGFKPSTAERINCKDKADAEELYAKIVMDINELANL